MSLLNRFKKGLTKSRQNIASQLSSTFKKNPELNEIFWESLEEILLSADVGAKATLEIVDKLKLKTKQEKARSAEEVKSLLIEAISDILQIDKGEILQNENQVIIVLGVNGVGKTTTIAKLAYRALESRQSVILAAADTFRAAAIEQLEEWARRLNAPIIKHERGSDPAAVIFDSIKSARARDTDFVIADTAGRLHTQQNLIEELKKIKRVAQKEAQGVLVLKTLLVLDATTGQNAIVQAKLFDTAIGVDEICLTKLDGTAKGGTIIAINEELDVPVTFIGIGEKIDDLEKFDAKSFAEALIS